MYFIKYCLIINRNILSDRRLWFEPTCTLYAWMKKHSKNELNLCFEFKITKKKYIYSILIKTDHCSRWFYLCQDVVFKGGPPPPLKIKINKQTNKHLPLKKQTLTNKQISMHRRTLLDKFYCHFCHYKYRLSGEIHYLLLYQHIQGFFFPCWRC